MRRGPEFRDLNGVLVNAIRILSELVQSPDLVAPNALSLIEIGKLLIDRPLDPTVWWNDIFLKHKQGLDQGSHSRGLTRVR